MNRICLFKVILVNITHVITIVCPSVRLRNQRKLAITLMADKML